MFKCYFIIFSVFLYSSLTHASESELTESPAEEVTSQMKEEVEIGSKLLERCVQFDAALSPPSNPSPRTPKTSAYKGYCVQVVVTFEREGKDQIGDTLKVTPTVKPWGKLDSPDAEHFFDYQEFDFFSFFSSFDSLCSKTGQANERPSAVRLRLWKNRNLMTYFVHQGTLEKALALFPEGAESFEQALYREIAVKEELKGTDYFSGEMIALKRAWKYLYDDFVILVAAIKEKTSPPHQCVLNLADRLPVYERRLKRYVASFEKAKPREETEFDRIIKKAEMWACKQSEEGV